MGAASDADRATIAALYRRVGFGLAPGELDDLAALGVGGVIDQLVEPDANDVPSNPDPWRDITFHDFRLEDLRKDDREASIRAWIVHMMATPRPLEEWMRWFWHGHLVSSLHVVNNASILVDQLRMFGTFGLGGFRDLLRAVTTDAAMLLYLNGSDSVARAPNENYGRELLELFALGVGNFSEDDVKAAAAALTGWEARRQNGEVTFRPGQHDDAPRQLVGVDGVHDVDTVIDAVVAHEACPRWVAASLAEAVIGADADQVLVDDLAGQLRRDDLAIRPLMRGLLEAGAADGFRPMILRPVPWLAMMAKAVGAVPTQESGMAALGSLFALGQAPMYPPNVAGWPDDTSWLAAGITMARFNKAALIAREAPDDSPPLEAAAGERWGLLADLLLHPEGFGEGTLSALGKAGPAGGRPGEAALTIAMASPEGIQA
jgi:uncharacterized protein (DUF1800 family)